MSQPTQGSHPTSSTPTQPSPLLLVSGLLPQAVPLPDPPTPPTLPPATPPLSPQSSQHPFPPHLTSGPAPSLSSTSRLPMPQVGGHTYFAGAHHFVVNDSQFNDFSLAGSGLAKLLKHSMPDAFHNAAARDPPPKCHLGTRKEYISIINDWAFGNSDHNEPILWMRGPFGVGKSAVAQSCAEALHAQNKLAATLFFSRSNTDRDNPRRVFTSIAYQITTICPSFRDIVDARIRDDPALTTKSLSTQYKELIAYPLSQIDKSGIAGRVVIIDGLDECRGSSEQCEIIKIIAASAHDQTTPFRWFITSRPEELIIRTMKSPTVSSISFHFELPVSRQIDHEILLYLTDEFKKIRENHGLTESWPSEEDLALIVTRTAGLWIYVTAIIRFIADENSLGPRDQLRIVTKFAKNMSTQVGVDNPLAEMDFFYTLIMQQIPLKIRLLVQKILLLHCAGDFEPFAIAGILCLSEEQFRYLCTFIQSVVELRQSGNSGLDYAHFHFYHASFLDFMQNPERSKELCIYGDFLNQHRLEYLDWLHQVLSRSTGPSDITLPLEPSLHGWTHYQHYLGSLLLFWYLFSVPGYPIDMQTALSFAKLPFQIMLRLIDYGRGSFIPSSQLEDLRNNLPTELRDKIVRWGKCPNPGRLTSRHAETWMLGYGDSEIVTRHSLQLELQNNQDPPPGRCLCEWGDDDDT